MPCALVLAARQVFKYVLAYLRARTTCSETVYLPLDEPSRALLAAEARYYMLPGDHQCGAKACAVHACVHAGSADYLLLVCMRYAQQTST